MATTPQQQNYVTELQQMAIRVITMQSDIQNLIARWNLNQFSTKINTNEVQAIAGWEHLTAQKIADAVATYQAILTALGDNTTGQITNLIKLKG